MNKVFWGLLISLICITCNKPGNKYEKFCAEKNITEYNLNHVQVRLKETDSSLKKQLAGKIQVLNDVYPFFTARYFAYHDGFGVDCISILVEMDDNTQIFLVTLENDQIIDQIEVARHIEDEFWKFVSYAKIEENKIHFTQDEIRGMHWSEGADIQVDTYEVVYEIDPGGKFVELDKKRSRTEKKVAAE